MRIPGSDGEVEQDVVGEHEYGCAMRECRRRRLMRDAVMKQVIRGRKDCIRYDRCIRAKSGGRQHRARDRRECSDATRPARRSGDAHPSVALEQLKLITCVGE